MPELIKIIFRILVCLIMIIAGSISASAQGIDDIIDPDPTGISNAALLFLRTVNSPMAAGMGQCAVNNVNGQSPLYNPGAFGVFHLNKVFSVTSPIATEWLPDLADDIRLKTFNISAGLNYRLFNNESGPYSENPFNIAFGLAYSKQDLDYGSIIRTDDTGAVIDTTTAGDKADYYTIGMGFEYYFNFGVGYSYKKIKSNLGDEPVGAEIGKYGRAEVNTYDYGLLLEIPIGRLLKLETNIDKENNRWLKINITPSFAYVMANNGDKKVVYNDPADGDPLPKMRHLGFSLYGDASINNSSIGSLRLTYQVSRDLAVDSLEYNIKHMGAELGFFDIVYLRLGKIDDEVGEIQSWSYGAGLNLGSALSWANIATGNAEGALEYMADHLDFWLEFAMYPDDEDEALSNTKFLKISLAI